jgi:hypothetical protein
MAFSTNGSVREPFSRRCGGKNDSSRGQLGDRWRVTLFEQAVDCALGTPAQLRQLSLCQEFAACNAFEHSCAPLLMPPCAARREMSRTEFESAKW